MRETGVNMAKRKKKDPPPDLERSVAYVLPRRKSRWGRRLFIAFLIPLLILGGIYFFIREDYEATKKVVLASSARQFPSSLKAAVLAAEEPRFYEALPGRSGITEQLLRYAAPQKDQSIQSQIKQFLTAVALDATLSKEAILNSYMDNVYLGIVDSKPLYGLESGARVYYNSPIDRLTLAQSATLAGIVRDPSGYSPFVQPDAAMRRRNTVLESMLAARALNEVEFDEASKAPIR